MRKKARLNSDAADQEKDVLRINPEYASTYEQSKRKKELEKRSVKDALVSMQLNKKADREDIDMPTSSSEDEDDDGELLTPRLDMKITETIERIRRRDPSLYDPSSNFFPDEDDDGEISETGLQLAPPESLKGKPVSVRQFLTEQLFEEAKNGEDSDSDLKKVYVPANEQVLARQAFLSAKSSGDDDEDELELCPIASTNSTIGNDEEYERFAISQNHKKRMQPIPETQSLKRLDNDEDLTPEDRFLKEYLAGEWWKDNRPPNHVRSAILANSAKEPDNANISEDEDFLDAQDSFEAAYNFRFEDPDGAKLVTHPRTIKDSLRRVDDRRIRRREGRKAAKRIATERAAEELKQAKNQLKKQRIEQVKHAELEKLAEMRQMLVNDKLEAIQRVSGVAGDDNHANRALLLSQLDIDADFNPDEFDKKMEAIFNKEYYEAKDNDKAAVRPSEAIANGAAPKVAKKPTVNPDATQAILEELYAMNYEDSIADGLRTRFRYTTVPSHSFGMDVDEILNEDDKVLNARVSIKQLAPYRTDRSLKVSWQELAKSRTARHRRKQARAKDVQPR